MQNEKFQVNLAPNMAKAELVIREGAAPKELEPKAPVKTDLSGVVLLSPGAQATLEDLRDKVIDEQLEQVKEIAPEIAIIEV